MLAAASACAMAGVNMDFIAQQLRIMQPVAGRMQKVCNKINVFVDYAHTPDGLEKSLTALKEIKESKRLICVFGCGGNRDRTKRAPMGKISGKLADFTVITTDNSRLEDDNSIINEIEGGIRQVTHEYIAIRDREQAIEYAVQIANVGDYLLIAGKGAEEYQELMGVFKPFSDKQIAIRAVKNKYDEF
jgi:UDP-N-acetylmuramoyl-L-alanyl-D-glutamate--2,6-diaminopimelate ligase